MSDQYATSSAIVRLMQGVVYREGDEDAWQTLVRDAAPVRDHFATIGVEVVVHESEGFAYLRSRPEVEGEPVLPRLVRRRALSYNVSLLLVLLRKRLLEFEAAGGEGRLVVNRDQVLDLLRTFQPDSSNEARMVEQVDRTIGKAVELGFLTALRQQPGHWEVRRVLKAYVDAQTMSDFEQRLRHYAGTEGDDG